MESASRAYYAAYQMITAVLLKLRLEPRGDYGNWSHHETVDMYHTHICKKASLGYKEKQALMNLFLKLHRLLETRYLADYGDSSLVVASFARSCWRDANRIVSLLHSLIQRGLL